MLRGRRCELADSGPAGRRTDPAPSTASTATNPTSDEDRATRRAPPPSALAARRSRSLGVGDLDCRSAPRVVEVSRGSLPRAAAAGPAARVPRSSTERAVARGRRRRAWRRGVRRRSRRPAPGSRPAGRRRRWRGDAGAGSAAARSATDAYGGGSPGPEPPALDVAVVHPGRCRHRRASTSTSAKPVVPAGAWQ